MPHIGPIELAVVLIIALVVFGPKRIPELGRSLGRGMREFKSSVTDDNEERPKRAAIRGDEKRSEHVDSEVVAEQRH